MEKVMHKIQASLCNGLRIGDIVSRFSVNQFVVLLPTCNYENAVLAIDRVLRKVRYSLNSTNFTIEISMEEVTPKE
ncbi:diguanylate cyclase [Amedibacterium intestinale]|nr:diguanylate cyclase [Amedibacterium intestinale]